MQLQTYITKKMNRLFDTERDDFEYLVGRFAESMGMEMVRSCEGWFDVPAYRNGTQAPKKGVYVHMLNQDISDLPSYLDGLFSVSGEVCVSDIDDMQHSTRTSKIGVVFEAVPTETFDHDCWSYVNKLGKRVAGVDSYDFEVNTARNESWIIPAKSKVKALIACENTFDEVSLLAGKIGVDVYPVVTNFEPYF